MHGSKPGSPFAPTIILASISAAAAAAIAIGYYGAVGQTLHAFIGVWLCTSAAMRLMDLKAFAAEFGRYDLLAPRWPRFGFIYPFIALALGLAHFSFVLTLQVYFATVLFFTFKLAGVTSARHRGVNILTPMGVMLLTESTLMILIDLFQLWL